MLAPIFPSKSYFMADTTTIVTCNPLLRSFTCIMEFGHRYMTTLSPFGTTVIHGPSTFEVSHQTSRFLMSCIPSSPAYRTIPTIIRSQGFADRAPTYRRARRKFAWRVNTTTPSYPSTSPTHKVAKTTGQECLKSSGTTKTIRTVHRSFYMIFSPMENEDPWRCGRRSPGSTVLCSRFVPPRYPVQSYLCQSVGF